MYKGLAAINGGLIAIMLFLNGILAKNIGIYKSTFIYYLSGAVLVFFIGLIKKHKFIKRNKLSFTLLIPGILNVLTILLNNITLPKIGVTLVTSVALSGQLLMSSIVENFGLFQMPINKLKKEKIIGFIFIALGIFMMIKW